MTPITIRDIVVHDGKLTEAGEALCAMVWGHPAFAIDGKPRCWHDNNLSGPDKRFKSLTNYFCSKCNIEMHSDNEYNNPDLLHDLNAVHELEMAWILKSHKHLGALRNTLFDFTSAPMFASARVRLEALATVLDVECGECGGSGFRDGNYRSCNPACLEECDSFYDKCPGSAGCDEYVSSSCKPCHGTGRVPIIDQWERKWRGK